MDPAAPGGAKRILVRAEYATLRRLAIDVPPKCHDAKTAKSVLQAPRAIWRGIRESHEAEWGWCYVRPVTQAFDRRGLVIDLDEAWLFFAFISPRHTLLEWGRERPDTTDPLLPEVASIRFGGLVWPTT